jgi:hypothetical protein
LTDHVLLEAAAANRRRLVRSPGTRVRTGHEANPAWTHRIEFAHISADPDAIQILGVTLSDSVTQDQHAQLDLPVAVPPAHDDENDDRFATDIALKDY